MSLTYTQPETGAVFTADHADQLVALVREHRMLRGLPIGSQLAREVLGMPAPCPAEDAPVKPRRLTLADVKQFLRTSSQWLSDGAQLVDQDEAERRAAICAACPMNVVVEGCWGCHGLAGLLVSTIGHRRTRQDSRLHGCAVCGCSNLAQVWFPAGALQAGGGDELPWPAACWKGRLLTTSSS